MSVARGDAGDQLAHQRGPLVAVHRREDLAAPEALDHDLLEDDVARPDLQGGGGHRAEDDEHAVLGEERHDVAGRAAADRVDAGDDRAVTHDLAHALAPAVVVGRDDVADALLAQLLDAGGAAYEPEDPTPRATASWATMRPTAPLAAFWTIQSPSDTSRKSSSAMALNGIETSWAAASSGISSGTGMRPFGGGHDVLRPGAERTADGDALADLESLDALAQRLDDAHQPRCRRARASRA